MKVVIPMAGRGSRFKKEGFLGPKPLIPILGKPMVQWTVESVKRTIPATDKDFIFVMLKEHDKEYSIGKKMEELVPGSQHFFIDDVTKGAAATVSLTKDLVNPDEELFVTDSDQYFILNKFDRERRKALSKGFAGIIPTKEAKSLAYSYVQINNDGFVIKTAEKELISTHAAIGVYYFTKSKYFMDSIKFIMDNKILTKNEYYVCPVYNSIVPNNKVTIVNADFWMTMGTPAEKETFEAYIKSR